MASASDSFTYSNGDLATVSGGLWVQQDASTKMYVLSNHVIGDQPDASAYRTGAWANDQEAYGTCTLDGTSYVGVVVRASGTGASRARYAVFCNGTGPTGHIFLLKTVAGVDTYLDSDAGGGIGSGFTALVASGSVLKLRVVGNKIYVYDDGVLIGASPYTDNSLVSGNPGVYGLDAIGGGAGGGSYLSVWSATDNVPDLVVPRYDIGPRGRFAVVPSGMTPPSR